MTRQMMVSCGKCGGAHARGTKCHIKRVRTQHDRERDKELTTQRWNRFRKLIIDRDGGICMSCYIKHGEYVMDNLQVHHIKPRYKYPELTYEATNCVTMCRTCNVTIGVQEQLDFDYEPQPLALPNI